jgi:hypothetical protein
MSLLIVGSCSRVTQGIVASLARQQLYQSITILDLLPTYDFHQRFYNLQIHLASQNSSTPVTINKITRVEELANQIRTHRDLLYVTHDYFQAVTSKTRLMELTAQLSGNVLDELFRKMPCLPLLLNTITSVSQTLNKPSEHPNKQL